MKYAKNEKGELCKVEDISIGIIRSYYNCIICNQKVIFVNESIKYCSHFRHYKNNKNVECEFYNFNNQNDNILENIIRNKASDFHIKWQKIFPKNNTEIKLYNDLTKIYKRADIYMKNIRNNIKDEQHEPIFSDNYYDLVIEVQNSYISEDEILEREYFYESLNKKLLWIFNLQNTDYDIEKINFYFKSIYRIKIKGGYISFIHLLNKQLIKNLILF